MPKYFVAEINVVKTYEVHVSASNEKDAAEIAKKKLRSQQNPKEVSSTITHVNLKFDGESNFGVGQKILHPVFGIGVIKDFSKGMSNTNELKEKTTIDFEDHGEKNILLSFAGKIEILE